ncbi:murein biosynthesis integral membrane protein MurJ [Senegalia sp. (in: firmicutes)]|uniref:murein biosynthesis integral membrane protein MurJ n=1 Tax=Senegalia sp. (in: firmicutes) TaxID=1924098 RepID=UPI003F9A2BC3
MKKTALVLMLLTIVSKLIGFYRDITLSYFYGASSISDAYLISLTIPLTIFLFIGTGISTSYIPLFSDIEKEFGQIQANRFTNNLINLLLILCSLIIILVWLFSVPIVKIFAVGFDRHTLDMAVNFTRVSILGIYFTGVLYIFKGYLQVKNNFVIPAIIGLPLNFFTIISIVLSSKSDIMILSVGSVIATASALLILLPSIYTNGYKYNLVLNLKDKYLRKLIYLSMPVIIGVSVNQINVLVDRTIASQIAVGGISALNYANRLNLFIQGIFVMSIATVMYPMISKMSSEKNMVGFKKSVIESISGINLLVIPATVGSMIFAKPVIKLLFGRGAFDVQAISMTSYALFFYSIGMIGFGLREVLSRVFYSLQDTKTPMINAAIGMSLNIVLNFTLSKYMGIGGLALATSIAAIFTTGLMFISLRKKIGPFGMKNISISFIKILCASLVMGLISKLSFNYLTTIISQNFSLLISIALGAVTYFIIIYFMNIEDVDVIVNAIKRKLKRNKTL